MGLNIKNDETERLARQLAAATGDSVTGAVTVAVRERLERVQGQDRADAEHRAALIRRIADDTAGRWIDPYRSLEHGELLYDEMGLPR